MSETAFEKWAAFTADETGYIDAYKQKEAAWNAAIDAALAVCREVTEWDDQCTAGSKECDTLIQKLRSE